MELTGAAATASVALSAVPGDTTTPIANKITDMSTYLLIVACAIILEKFLLTITGYLTFNFLIPISCILFGIYIFTHKHVLKNLAFKLTVFGIIIVMIVPISVKISNLIDNTYQISSEQNDVVDIKEESEDKGLWDNIKDNISAATDTAEKYLSDFTDKIAVLLITSCGIPVAVIFFMLWIVKIIFKIDINVPRIKNREA